MLRLDAIQSKNALATGAGCVSLEMYVRQWENVGLPSNRFQSTCFCFRICLSPAFPLLFDTDTLYGEEIMKMIWTREQP